MSKLKFMKKIPKRTLSFVLALLMMCSLAVPFSVYADEPATGNDIVAYLRRIDTTVNKDTYNLELVFAKSSTDVSGNIVGTYTGFADNDYVTTTYKFDNSGRITGTYGGYKDSANANLSDTEALPWYNDSNKGDNIRKVTFLDKIAPKYIAGWFFNMRYLVKFVNLETNLDTSRCEDMSFAFWHVSTRRETSNNIYDGERIESNNLKNKYLTSLDLSGSHFDTSNVKRMDYFLYTEYLNDLDVSGMDLSGLSQNKGDIARYSDKYFAMTDMPVKNLMYFINGGNGEKIGSETVGGITSVNLDGLDLSGLENIKYFVYNTRISKLDLSKVEGPKHVYNTQAMFYNNTMLTEIIFGTDSHPFEYGTEPQHMGKDRNSDANKYTNPSNNTEYSYKSNTVWLESCFQNAASLETIDLEHFIVNKNGKDINGTDYPSDDRNLNNGLKYQTNSLFQGCTNLTEIKNLNNINYKPSQSGNWAQRSMFRGCESLTSIDMSDYYGYLGGPYIFKDCKNLKTLNLARMGQATNEANRLRWKYDTIKKGFESYDNDNNVKVNIYEGCTELSEITFSPYYFQDVPEVSEGSTNLPSIDAMDVLKYTSKDKSNYSSIVPDIPPVGDARTWTKIKQPDPSITYIFVDNNSKKYVFDEFCDVGTAKSTLDLFGDFKPEYAGTWVLSSKIALVAKSGDPYQQTFEGAVGLELNNASYNKANIKTPVRTGYDFLGWFATDEKGVKKNLAEQLAANADNDPDNNEVGAAWAYYAEWNEHKYTIRLHKNLRPVEDEEKTEGDILEYTLKYSQPFKLPDDIFENPGNPDSVITNWNMRAGGTGTRYAANDSVDRLTIEDGGVIDLYAQWHIPAAVVRFDTTARDKDGNLILDSENNARQGTPVGRRDYQDIPNDCYKTYYNSDGTATELPLSGSYLDDDYSFLGWYTANGQKIEDDDHVAGSETLHARWTKKPNITFDLQGGHIKDNDNSTYTKVCEYDQYIGEVPTPVKENSTFKGWFTAATGGDTVDTYTTKATSDKTYYAQWGYQPHFDTNGGSYLKDENGEYIVPSFSIQSSSQITFTSDNLPRLKKENSTFAGWYIGNKQICDGNYNIINGNGNVDLSQGDTLQARWNDLVVHTVKLYKEESDHTGNEETDKPYQTVNVYDGKSTGQFNTPSKDNYIFEGWYTQPNGGGTKITDSSVITSDMVLYAKWTAESYTVTFHKNMTGYDAAKVVLPDATTSDTYTMYVAADNIVDPIPGANWTDSSVLKTFMGWYPNPDGTGDKLTSSTKINANVDYYAKWENLEKEPSGGAPYGIKTMIRWSTQSDSLVRVTNLGDDLIFYPDPNKDYVVSAGLDLKFSHNDPIAPGQLEIRIPRALFKDWDGNGLFNDNIASAATSDLSSDSADFGYTISRDGNYYIITNLGDPQQDSVFKLNYKVDPKDVKGGYTDENGEYHNYYGEDANGDGSRDESEGKFHISIKLKSSGSETYDVVLDERDLGVEFHNEVVPAVSKTKSEIYYEWNSDWGAEPPDSKEYLYIKWRLHAQVDKCNQPYYLQWSEDTVHDGAVVWPDLSNSAWNESGLSSGGSSDFYVVTKHLRGDVKAGGEWKKFTNEAILNLRLKSDTSRAAVQKYRSSAETQAFIEDKPTGDYHVFEKYSFDPDGSNLSESDKHYKYGAQDLVISKSIDDPNFSLDYYLKYKEVDNKDNPVALASGEILTKTRRYVFTDGACYDDENKRDLIITQRDPNRPNDLDYKPLEDSDYCFRLLDIYITEYTAKSLPGDQWSAPYPITNQVDYGNVVVYIRRANSNDFELYKTVKGADLVGNANVKSTQVELPQNVAGYKVEYSSNKFTTDIKIHASMGLKPSYRLQSLVSNHLAESRQTMISNKANLDIYRDGVPNEKADEPMANSNNIWEASWVLTESESELYASKISVNQSDPTNIDTGGNMGRYFKTDVGKSTVTYVQAMEGWVKRKSSDGFIKRVTSGVFYDLLPKGDTVDKNTIKIVPRVKDKIVNGTVQTYNSVTQNSEKSFVRQSNYNIKTLIEEPNNFYLNGKTLPESAYSVRFVDNWENTGQTMMIIDISCPDDIVANGFGVYYLCTTSINNLHINSVTQINYMSFTDTTPGQTEPDLRSGSYKKLSTQLKSIFASVDNNQTAYANATNVLNTPALYQYGADSTVTTEGSDIARKQIIGLNTNYYYNVSYEGSTACQTDDLVIYDVIERQLGGNASQWDGTFQGIDVSNIRNQESAVGNGNCDPKVYYSTLDKDKFTNELFDLNATYEGQPVWTVEPPENLASVTAVAVDCRYTDSDTVDKAFRLPKSKGVDFTIKMLSPSNPELAGKNTYNEAVIKGQNYEINYPINSTARTSVLLKYTAPKFTKSALPATGSFEVPESVVYNSVLEYKLRVANQDNDVAINEVKVRDAFPVSLLTNNTITVRFKNGDPVPIEKSARVKANITTDNNGTANDDSDDLRVFEATIDTIDPNDWVEITIPVQVTAPVGTKITNTAEIVSINGNPFNPTIKSDTTYHKVTGVKAKIQKVNAAGDPLSGAVLQIFEKNDTNCNSDGSLKEGAVPINLMIDDPNNPNQSIAVPDVNKYTTDDKVWYFNVPRGSYILHEETAPAGYTKAADIPFEIDMEGAIRVNNEIVTYVTMVDEPDYKVEFHTNYPDMEDSVYKVVQNNGLDNNKVSEFSDYPVIEGNHLKSFTGWYTAETGGERIDFSETYDGTTGNFVTENGTKVYKLYAHWQNYKVIFHSNEPSTSTAHVEPEFRIFENVEKGAFPVDKHFYLDKEYMIAHFYDIPDLGDEYVFAGWYHNADYSKTPDGNTPADFDVDAYEKRDGLADPDYHLYAKWIKVGEIDQDAKDSNVSNGKYRGFGLKGVQIRPGVVMGGQNMEDPNFGNAYTNGGLRFITSLSESLISDIKGINKIANASNEAKNFGVEYGYVVGRYDYAEQFYNNYNKDNSLAGKYKLQYNGTNVNGKDTTGAVREADSDYRYISNVNCTSNQNGTTGIVEKDHRNFTNYRLYSLVINYEAQDEYEAATEEEKSLDLDARAYLRYYDGNGKLRVFYNDYNDNPLYFGGCKCNYTQVLEWYNSHPNDIQ